MGDSVGSVVTSEPSQQHRAREIVTGVVGGLSVAVLCFHITLAVIAGVSNLAFSGPTFVIVGSSMEPALKRGSVVVEEQVGPSGVGVGDIVTFRLADRVITHRVTEITTQGITTRGDNNEMADSTVLSTEDLLGRARLVVPYLGWPKVWLSERNYLALGLWSGALAACVVGAARLREME